MAGCPWDAQGGGVSWGHGILTAKTVLSKQGHVEWVAVSRAGAEGLDSLFSLSPGFLTTIHRDTSNEKSGSPTFPALPNDS
jgi:hypothetical protein